MNGLRLLPPQSFQIEMPLLVDNSSHTLIYTHKRAVLFGEHYGVQRLSYGDVSMSNRIDYWHDLQCTSYFPWCSFTGFNGELISFFMKRADHANVVFQMAIAWAV